MPFQVQECLNLNFETLIVSGGNPFMTQQGYNLNIVQTCVSCFYDNFDYEG